MFDERKPEGKPVSICILHVGMRKTGTSSIQQSLRDFSDEEFLFANIDGHTNHGAALYSMFSKFPENIAFHINNNRNVSEVKEYIRKAREGLDACLRNAKNKNVIFSGESLSYTIELEGLERMRDFFLEKFDEIKIVASIRPPTGYITSNFVQRVKDRANNINLDQDYFEYQKHLSKFDHVFGSDNVSFWKFDPKSYPNKCAVQDFCKRIGLVIPQDKIVRVNEALSLEAVSLLFTYNKLRKNFGSQMMSGPQRKILVDSVSRIGSKKFRFSPDIIRPVIDTNNYDIKWMEDRIGESLYEDLGEYHQGDVRNEVDLLEPDSYAVVQLKSLLGDALPKGVKGDSPEDVALLVHSLYEISAGKNIHPVKKRSKLNRGRLMRAEPGLVAGWMIGSDFMSPVQVVLFVNGVEVANTVADKMRKGLVAQCIHPTGYCGFVFRFDGEHELKPGDKIEVKALESGTIQDDLFAEVGDTNNK